MLVVLLCGLAVAPAAGADTTLLPWTSGGYAYRQVAHGGAPAGFEQPSFDDSGWSTGEAGFGNPGNLGCGLAIVTHWDSDTDLLLRRHVAVPANARGLVVHAAIDNDIQVFFNGHDISGGLLTHDFCAFRDNIGPFAVPAADVDPGGNNVLAVLARDRGGPDYVDVSVVAAQVTGPIAELRDHVAFGPHLVGRTTQNGGVVSVRNTGADPLHVGATSIAGLNPHQFSVTGDDCSGATVDPGDACRLTTHFGPTTTGDLTARLVISDDAPGNPHQVVLTGTGVSEPRLRIRDAVTFPDTPAGEQSPATRVVARNTGTEPLTISDLTLGGADPAACPLRDATCLAAPLPPGARCSFLTRLRPTGAGPRAADVEVADDAPGAPHHVALSGTGT